MFESAMINVKPEDNSNGIDIQPAEDLIALVSVTHSLSKYQEIMETSIGNPSMAQGNQI
jgi:hypothetical protein